LYGRAQLLTAWLNAGLMQLRKRDEELENKC